MNRLSYLDIDSKGFCFDATSGECFQLNESGNFIVKIVKEGKEFDEVVESLMKEYKISFEKAYQDVVFFFQRLKLYQLVD